MAEKNRASSLAIVEESTAGTPVAPTLATQFIALQEGFSLNPNFNSIDNNELRNSIGVSKSIQGLESPEGSLDHYLRHSGVEGQAPNYILLMESLIGSASTNSTQRLTAAASTTSVVKLAAGGSDFAKGKAVLVKDGTNGYSVRPVDSVSSNDLTLGFQLDAAPASGLGVGKCVNVSPANEGHPTYTSWLYRGGGGALEMLAGCRTSEASVSVAAGELVNASYSMQGTKYHFNPITIVAGTNDKLDFTDDDGTFAATIPDGVYRHPAELAAAIESAMESANPGETKTVTYLDASGKFKIQSSGTVLSLLFLTGANNADSIDTTIGFTHTDHTGTAASTGYTSDSAMSWASSITPSYDSGDPLAAKNNEVLIGDADDVSCFCASSIDISISNDIQDVNCICAESGVQEKIINQRSVEINVVGVLTRHDADKFKKFAGNENVKFLLNLGSKSGGNWVPGTVVSIYSPTATVSSHEAGDDNGVVTLNLTIKPYVGTDGGGEIFLNYL
jgi:hypothetical protein